MSMKTLVVAFFMIPGYLASAAFDIDFISVDNSSVLTGYNTFDIQLTTTTSDWAAAALLLNLSSGSMYQDAVGGDTPPNPVFFSLFPSLEFDTYVGVTGGSIAGAAGDVGGDNFEFSNTELDVSYFDTSKDDVGTFSIGRVTFSTDAIGSWSMMTSTADSLTLNLSGTIDQGAFIINPMASFFAEPIIGEITTEKLFVDESGTTRSMTSTQSIPTGNYTVTRPYWDTTTIEPWYDITGRTFEPIAFDVGDSLPEPASLLISGLLATILVVNRRI